MAAEVAGATLYASLWTILKTSVRTVLEAPIRAILDSSIVTRTRDASRAVARSVEVSTIPTIVQSEVLTMWGTIDVTAAVVVSATSMNVPGMSTTIGSIEVRTSEVEVVTMRIAAIDAEVPVSSVPVEWTIEVGGCYKSVPLPVEEDIAQIQITTLPIGSEDVGTPRHPHQVVEVDLIDSLILLVSQIQLVCHFIGKEQGLVASLLIAHCTCCQRGGQHHYQCEKHLLHIDSF